MACLERLAARGFHIVAFPMYATAVGVQKGNCAVLLSPAPDGSLRILSGPHYLIDGHLAVRLDRGGRSFYVWKKSEVPATDDRVRELDAFALDLGRLLGEEGKANTSSAAKPE